MVSSHDGVTRMVTNGCSCLSRLLGPWRLLVKAQGRAAQLDVLEVLSQQRPALWRAGRGRSVFPCPGPHKEVPACQSPSLELYLKDRRHQLALTEVLQPCKGLSCLPCYQRSLYRCVTILCRSYSRPLSKQMEDIPLAEGGGGTGQRNGHRAGDLDSIFEKMGTGRVRHKNHCT